ncbi:MAG: V-type ATP synthase subunit E [Methanomicrobiales archaeon]|nr:V-type ATP synthase subunit E [Methanomicrobiales archaeon]
MALDAVVGEIREKGRKEAERIRLEADSEVKAVLSAAQQKAESIKLSVHDEVERQGTQIIAQETAAASLVVKRNALNVQKELLDEVYTATVAGIAGLPEDFHKKAVVELCRRAAKELSDAVVYCNARDKAALEEALKKVKELSGFSLGAVVDIDGGIIAESRDGDLQLDFSYPTFLSEVWESGLKDASDILFR